MSGSTTLLKYIKPTVSGDADVWGGYLNTNFDSIDKLQNVVTTTGSANAYLLTSGQSSLAYATGQRFRCKLNFTCSGSSTLNVDSIGAKTIKKRDATTNVSSSDLVSGQIYTFTYDGTNMVLETYVASDVQPLDATLTALAALSWASGNPLVQFTAADTVSLTLTPSVSSITTANATGAGTPAGTFKNTTDNASVQALRVGGARATPTASDAAYLSLVLNNSSGAEKEFGRISALIGTVTAGAEGGTMRFGCITSGSFANYVELNNNKFGPITNDLLPLGTAALSWADLFLASGGVINWNNGTAVLTQSGALLDVTTGALRTRIPVSTETTGVLTAASANKKVKMSGDVTINTSVFTADDFILFENNSASTRTVTQGASVTLRLSGSATTGSRTMAIRSAALAIFDTASDVTLHGGNVT